MGCGDEKLSKYLTQTFTAHCNAMICQQVTLSGDAEWPKVADAVIEAVISSCKSGSTLINVSPFAASRPVSSAFHSTFLQLFVIGEAIPGTWMRVPSGT